MTEYEIIYLFSEYLNRTWEVMQFWASVSFGLIALSHLGARYLNALATVIVSAFYIAFTLFVMNILRINGIVGNGFLTELSSLKTLGPGAQKIIATAPTSLEMTAIITTFFGLFLGSLVFLWLSFWRAHKAKQPATVPN